ncbi:MAG: hypothetical protein IPJ53_00115 [Saprospiraceae bacterium]|nr:hypothetical protein [Candidatus Vicinibacter affinis]
MRTEWRKKSRRSRSEHELAPSSTVSASLRSILWGGLLHYLALDDTEMEFSLWNGAASTHLETSQ